VPEDFGEDSAMTTIRQLLREKGGQVWSIRPDTSVLDALEILAEHEVGALLVMEGELLRGIVSERDYTRKVERRGRSSADTRISEIMTPDPVCVSADDTIDQCMALMTARRIRHLPVLEDGKLAGLVSIGDIVKAVIARQENLIEQMEQYIAGRT
jgi:CBS domain-containing protein